MGTRVVALIGTCAYEGVVHHITTEGGRTKPYTLYHVLLDKVQERTYSMEEWELTTIPELFH